VDIDPTCGNHEKTADYVEQTFSSVAVVAGVNTVVDAALVLGGSIAGRVADIVSGAGVAGACVQVYGPTQSFGETFGAAGGYVATGLAAGTYTVYFEPACSSSNYVAQWYPTSVTVTAGVTTPNVNFQVSDTSTTVTSSANPASVGNSVTYTATVSPTDNGGTVSYSDGGNPIADCQSLALSGGEAKCVVTTPSAGTHTIVATYSGDTNWEPSISAAFNESVLKATMTVVTSSASPIVYGTSVTYTATVTPTKSSGTVAFTDGGNPITACQSQAVSTGKATCVVSNSTAGAHTIVAIYSGDSKFGTSTSAAITETVTRAPTTTVVAPSANPISHGTSVTYTATVSPANSSGTVAFTDGGVPITGCQSQAVSAGKATCVVPNPSVGTHTIVAIYSGDPNHKRSTSPAITETVTRAPTTTVVAPSANPISHGTSVTYTATVSPANSSGTVAFTDGGNPITACQSQAVSAGKATCVVPNPSVGTHTIVAIYSGSKQYKHSTSIALSETVT
jgi:hypothetical protein